MLLVPGYQPGKDKARAVYTSFTLNDEMSFLNANMDHGHSRRVASQMAPLCRPSCGRLSLPARRRPLESALSTLSTTRYFVIVELGRRDSIS